MNDREQYERIEVSYELHRDDLVAFSRHTYRTSPTVQRLRKGGYIFIGLLLLTGDAVVLWVRRFWPWELLVMPVARMLAEFVVYMAVYHFIIRWLNAYNMKRFAKEGRNVGILCKHVTAIDKDSITDTTEVGQSTRSWRAVERVEESADHIFLYVGAMTALVIPKWGFETVQRAQEFFDAARDYQRIAEV